MSRRKQPNPKHAKRESDLEELACLVHLPTDLLYVKEFDPKEEEEEEVEEGKSANIINKHSTGYSIFAKRDLKADAVLATYKGHIILGSEVPDYGAVDGNCLRFNCTNSRTSVHVMIEDDDGHWLKLIRKATPTSEANICLRITCSDVVCLVAKDVSRDVELRVTCEISDQSANDKRAFDQIYHPHDEHGQDSESLSVSGVVSDSDVKSRRASDMPDIVTAVRDSEERDSEEISTKSEDCRAETNAAYEGDHQHKSYDNSINTPLHYGNEMSDNAASPSSDPDRHDLVNRKLRERKQIKSLKNSVNVFSSDANESHSRSPNADERTVVNTDELYECPFCAFKTNRYNILSKHTKFHYMSSNKDKSTDDASTEQTYCEACSIKFMSPSTYNVHKYYYCKSRHIALDNRHFHIPSETDSQKNVFLSGKKQQGEQFTPGNGMIPNVIQPQAIFAALSTNPLILLPCSIVDGQGLVSQNGLISTGVPIVLPTSISSASVIENGLISSTQLNQTCERTNNCAELNSLNKPINETKNDASDYSDDSADKKIDDIDVLNLSKSEEKASLNAKSIPDIAQEGPLDLTIRKRKTSCYEVQRSESRPAAKRRNSFASVSPVTPSVQKSPSFPKKKHSSSPEPYYFANHHSSHPTSQVTAVSPSTFNNDASNSSGFGPSSAPTLTISDAHGLCNVQEGSSPAPPVLLSVLDNNNNNGSANARRPTIPYSLPPPKLLKQGNNRCEDCNIVFYKYDNYLAHKEHYCAYRQRQLAHQANQLKEDLARASSDVSSSDDNSSSAVQSESANYDEKPVGRLLNQHLDFALENLITVQPPVINKPSQSAIFRCDACGVKFSSADNLHAHQTYYCSSATDFPNSKFNNNNNNNNNNNPSRKSSKSRDELVHSCPTCGESEDSHEELCCPDEWKCNFCDIVCPSLKSARKHLLTHSEIRGFCCTVCGYRGNTLRGMRGHLYEHVNGDASQIDDILASSLVVAPVASGRHTADFSGNEESRIPSPPEGKLVMDENKDLHFHTSTGSVVGTSRDNLASDESSLSPHHSTQISTSSNFSSCEEKEFRKLKKSPYERDRVESSEKPLAEESDGSETSRHYIPGVMCDVLIKTEVEDYVPSPEKIIPERECSSPGTVDCSPMLCHIKEDPISPQSKQEHESEDEEIDVEEEMDKVDIKTELQVTCAATSVICHVSSCRNGNKVNNEITKESPNSNLPLPKRRKLKTSINSGLELNYCKSCDISFNHPSNFIAHKKFYCVSRVVENFQQEAASVQ